MKVMTKQLSIVGAASLWLMGLTNMAVAAANTVTAHANKVNKSTTGGNLRGLAGNGGNGNPREPIDLNIYTRNVYIGASVSPIFTGDPVNDPLGFAAALQGVFDTILATNFALRAAELAKEIVEIDADIIGLQEVWRLTVFADEGGTTPLLDFDYLSILLSALSAKGASYTAVSTNEVTISGPNLPVSLGGQPGFFRGIDRDVILIKDSINYDVKNEVSEVYTHLLPLPSLGSVVGRGYHYVDLEIGDQEFRVANTHIEVEEFTAINQFQATEFRHVITGHGNFKRPIIAMGDFNANPGGNTGGLDIIKGTDFVDAWTTTNPNDDGSTCCIEGTLTDPLGVASNNVLDERLDYVLYRDALDANDDGDLEAKSAKLVGDTEFQETQPRFSSDHTGVVATINIA